MKNLAFSHYESPLTERYEIEVESSVCNASPGIEQNYQGETNNHDGNSDFSPSFENPDSWV